METTLILSLVVFLFAVWNALVIQWYITKEKRYSDDWHTIGWLIRACMGILVFLSHGYFGAWIYSIIAWPIYDITVNLIRGLPWNHTGENLIDKHIFFKILKILVILSGLLFLI